MFSLLFFEAGALARVKSRAASSISRCLLGADADAAAFALVSVLLVTKNGLAGR